MLITFSMCLITIRRQIDHTSGMTPCFSPTCFWTFLHYISTFIKWFRCHCIELYSRVGMLNETVNSIPISLFLGSNGLEYIDLYKRARMGWEKYITNDDLLLVKKFAHIEFGPKSEVSDIYRLMSLVESSGFSIKVLNHKRLSWIWKRKPL